MAFNLSGFASSQKASPAKPGHHHYVVEELYAKRPLPTPRRLVTGDYVKQRAPRPGEEGFDGNDAVDAIFGKLPPKSLGGPPPDRVTRETIEQLGSRSARGPRHRMPMATSAPDSARGAAEYDPHAPPEEWLTDDQALAAFQRAEALPPHRRVEERMRLLHKYDYLRSWVASRAASHTRERAATQDVDYMQRNADSGNFTQEAVARKAERLRTQNRTREKRTVYALSVARSPDRKNDNGGFSSELLTRVRLFRRMSDLRRGFTALHGTIDAKRAQRWLAMVHLAHATLTMFNMGKLARVVKRIRTTSRVISAVRTVQRRFRDRREAASRSHFIWNLVSIQRRVKYWLGLCKRRKMRNAAGVVIDFLQACGRLSPMEVALHRYALRVRIMQRFARGYFAITKGKLLLLGLQWRKVEITKLVEAHYKGNKGGHKGTAGAPTASSSKLKVDKQGRVVAGEYAGVPEEMLDVPLPHVPEVVRNRVLKRLLSELRQLFITESITWDQKVLLAAEQHPALAGGDQAVRRLAVAQHERAKAGVVPEKGAAILSVLKKANEDPKGAPAAVGEPASPAPKSAMSLMRSKIKKVSSSLAEQRQALEEIRSRFPRPFQRILVPAEVMRRAFNECYQHCKDSKTLEMRPIRGARK